MFDEQYWQEYSTDSSDSAEAESFVEMCRRAVTQHDQRARQRVQYKVSGVMRDNLRHHPWYGQIRQAGNEEQFIALAFERFWQSANVPVNGLHEQQEWFNDQSAIFRRLRAALNSVVLETLRANTRQREMRTRSTQLSDAHSLWGLIQRLVPDRREQRVAYLLYHCGLKPTEIVRSCSDEFTDTQEVKRLSYSVLEKISQYV